MICFTRLVPYIRNQVDLARLNLIRQGYKVRQIRDEGDGRVAFYPPNETDNHNGHDDSSVISAVLDLRHFVMFESDVFSDVITNMSFRSEDVVSETSIVIERPPIYVEGKPSLPQGEGPRWMRGDQSAPLEPDDG
jgi:hypothetical protein